MMFQAILNSKVRDQFDNIKKGDSWRKIYRETEDFLTAAIIGRLVYLKPNIAWHTIRNAVVSKSDLSDDIGALKMVEFWPRWEFPETYYEDLGLYKEPDVFLRFEKYDLVIEAKLRDNSIQQSAEQWAFEYVAYLEQTELEPREESFLFAIGGLADCSTNLVHSMENEANELISVIYPGSKIKVMACSWQMLLNSFKKLQKGAKYLQEEVNQYLYNDIKNILGFHGVRTWEWLNDLPKFSHLLSTKAESYMAINNWLSTGSELDVQDQWWKLAEKFRSIKTESINILGRPLQ